MGMIICALRGVMVDAKCGRSYIIASAVSSMGKEPAVVLRTRSICFKAGRESQECKKKKKTYRKETRVKRLRECRFGYVCKKKKK